MGKTNSKLFLPAHGYTMDNSIAPDGTVARNVLRSKAIRDKFILGMAGGAQGTHEAADIIAQTIDGVSTNDLWDAYRAAVALRNKSRQPLIDFLTFTVTDPFEGVSEGSSGAKFERASQYGVPRSYRAEGSIQWLGYDFEWFDMAGRFTWQFLADATAQQVDTVANAALEADSALVFGEIMWCLFNNVNRSTKIDTRPYTVYTFYNGTDGVTPPAYRNTTFPSNHTHYFTSGAATIVPADMDDLIVKLTEHGYTKANGADIVVMLNEVEGDVVRQWRSIANGGTAKYDFIPARDTPSFLLPINFRTPDGGLAQLPAPSLRGMKVIGSYGEATIIQEDYIPAGYVVAFATGGTESVQNPIGFREHKNTALRGLRLVKGRSDDYPLQEALYQRGFGTGIRKRGAGAIMQITASASYTVPTMYATPAA